METTGKRWISRALAAAAVLLAAPRGDAANVCTYNDPATSFGSSYTQNSQTGQTAAVCSTAQATTAARLNETSFGRTVITAPNTGDFKFLQKTTTSTSVPPTIAILLDDQNEMLQFPDGNILVPAVGAGCDDYSATNTNGIDAIERHLHRGWPLFGQTYFYGDYNASPPNDPMTVSSSSSPYAKWWVFDPTKSYTQTAFTGKPSTSSFGTGTNGNLKGYYPAWSGGLVMPGGVAGNGACSSAGLTAAEAAQCQQCINKVGYYLHDGTKTGDLKKSVFSGTILNDYPPAWVHAAWAYGFLENDTIADASGGPMFRMMHETVQSQTTTCNQSRAQKVAGWVPSCPKVYPTYDWAFIQGDQKWAERQKAGEGQNQTWASYGGPGQGNTPVGDYMTAAADVLQIMTTGCKNCQSGAVVTIGFGIPCGETRPSGLPVQTMAPCTGDCAYVDTSCGCTPSGGNYLAEAAHYQYNTNGIRSYFIGMGPHTGAMRRAAAEGHGRYLDARDAEEFHDALMGILQELVNVATSSATSTLNSVQVSVAGQEEIVPRFVAKSTAGNWEGHLLKYYLFSEFAANCTKKDQLVPVPNPQQPVCSAACVCPGGSCTATWLVDAECKLITPDKTGFLAQATWDGTKLAVPQPASCTTNADCGGKVCDLTTKTCPPVAKGAVPLWDANDLLQARDWYTRNVYTAIDSNGDGAIDAADGMLKLTNGATAGNVDLSGGVSDAVADALIPYMAIENTGICGRIETKLGTLLPGTAATRRRACARVILNYALGEDLLNENQLSSTDPSYRTVNRIDMLGDIFHSSPENIGPPASEAECNTNTRRCVATIFNNGPLNGLPNYQPLAHPTSVVDPATGNTVLNAAGVDAYQAYYQDETFGKRRPRAVAVGANDGMVHAFQTSCFVGTTTVNGVVTPSYWDGAGSGSCASAPANGTELWAFIPPDLLPKLALMLLGDHQFFVDNSPMVRDIYAPTGTPTPTKNYDTISAATMDFKRVAVFGEREGGTHWFALDVTDPTQPGFRWIFPQPNTEDELAVGQSWGDWVPNAPPIVPVRLAAPTGAGTFPSYVDSTGTAKSFQEKWVVLLPGGYDPYGVVGKHVYMLDAWSGAKVFQTNDTGSIKQDFPFAALPAAIPWGTQTVAPTTTNYNNGFFDTAIYGDIGGQVWTLRFNDVGQGFPGGLVNNWFFGRGFREAASEDTGASPYKMQHRNPFFQMPSAARLNEGSLRAFIGTGDRANSAEPGVGQCSIYNPQACGKLQCTMTVAENLGAGGNPVVSGVTSFKGDLAATYATSWSESFTAQAASCSPDYAEVSACVSCPNAATGNKATTPAAPSQPQYACTNTSSGWRCGVNAIDETSVSERLEVQAGTPNPNPAGDIGYYNRFIAYNVFDNATPNPRAIFTTAAQAATYDSRALTEASLVNLFAANASKTFSPSGNTILAAQASGSGPGYFFYYPVIDERTATNSVVAQNCVSWYTMEPGQECASDADCTAGTCDTTLHRCISGAVCSTASSTIPARSAFLYQVNASDGSTNCGLTSSNYLRSAAPLNAFLVPPPPPQELVSINSRGQMQYSIVAPAGQLSPPASTGIGGATVPFSFFYTVEVPRELEMCRHQFTADACYP